VVKKLIFQQVIMGIGIF